MYNIFLKNIYVNMNIDLDFIPLPEAIEYTNFTMLDDIVHILIVINFDNNIN